MKSVSKLQIIDLKDERSDFERELTTEEIKKIVGGVGEGHFVLISDEDDEEDPHPKQCRRRPLSKTIQA
jgi:hypothetical protein